MVTPLVPGNACFVSLHCWVSVCPVGTGLLAIDLPRGFPNLAPQGVSGKQWLSLPTFPHLRSQEGGSGSPVRAGDDILQSFLGRPATSEPRESRQEG